MRRNNAEHFDRTGLDIDIDFHAMRGDAFLDLIEGLDLASPESLRSEVILMPPESMPSAVEMQPR